MNYIFSLGSYLLFVYWQQILCDSYSDLWSSIFIYILFSILLIMMPIEKQYIVLKTVVELSVHFWQEIVYSEGAIIASSSPN